MQPKLKQAGRLTVRWGALSIDPNRDPTFAEAGGDTSSEAAQGEEADRLGANPGDALDFLDMVVGHHPKNVIPNALAMTTLPLGTTKSVLNPVFHNHHWTSWMFN